MSDHFRKVAPQFMEKLREDFGFSALDVAAIFGNFGHESNGFESMQELNPRSGRGGWGWAQWTGPRRRAFEAYAKRNNLSLSDPATNYKFLFVELKGPEKSAINAVKEAKNLRAKTIAFERAFERAGVKHYDSRYRWAKIALSAYEEWEKKPKTVNFWDWFLKIIGRLLWFGRS